MTWSLRSCVWLQCCMMRKRCDPGSWRMLFGKAPSIAWLGKGGAVWCAGTITAPRCWSTPFGGCSPLELMSILWTREGNQSGINIFSIAFLQKQLVVFFLVGQMMGTNLPHAQSAPSSKTAGWGRTQNTDLSHAICRVCRRHFFLCLQFTSA